jgi:hypothetical protein
MMAAVLFIFSALATEVPPNFNTCISDFLVIDRFQLVDDSSTVSVKPGVIW